MENIPGYYEKEMASFKWISQQSELLQGPLNLALRLGRPFGMSPITYSSKGVKIFKPLRWYSFFLISIYIFILTECLLDTNDLIFGGFKTKIGPLFLISTVTALSLSIYAIFNSTFRMERMICFMGQLEKIKTSLRCKVNNVGLKRKRILIMLLALSLLLTLSFYDYLHNHMHKLLAPKILNRSLLHHLSYIMLAMVNIQFVFMVIAVNDVLRELNNNLEEISRNVNSQTCRNISCLALAYNQTCSVVRQICDAHGPVMFLLISILFLNLVASPIYMLTLVNFEESLNHKMLGTVTITMLWSLCHLLALVAIMEPCHGTQVETQRIRNLTNKLLITAYNREQLYNELENFQKQLLLNTTCFSILQITCLGRPFMFSILGTVTTYSVIVLQFKYPNKW